MNPPPDRSVTAKLEGSVVDAITIVRYHLSFVCEDRKSFSVSSPFCFGRADKIADMAWSEFPLVSTDVSRMFGSTIVTATTDEAKSLRIEFSTGDVLLASWIPIYESYEIEIDGERIIV